jgi:hypothetical protein
VLSPRRRLSVLLVALLATAAALVPATGAAAQTVPPGETEPPGAETQIVGGTKAPAGSYAWTAGLIRRGASRTIGFSCGASIMSRSWVLTAAHCLLDVDGEFPDRVYGKYVPPSYYDVLTGTSSLTGTGGQRLPVTAVYVHPSFKAASFDYDIALLRLARPTSGQEIAVVGTSAAEQALDDAGATAIVSGWGSTFERGPISTELRYVGVPIQSHTTCSSAYYPGFGTSEGLLEYHASNMICAGPMAGGKDSCQGDSGGPLAVRAPDTTWRLIGTVSFGLGCAEPGYPGVYQRLTATSSWIGQVRRFGPFNPDATGYIYRQFVDFAGRYPTASELSSWRSKLASQPAASIVTSLQAGPAWDGNAGMNVRLYQAAFQRNPDSSGLDYWVRQRWAGRGPVSIANHFTASSEFRSKFGNPTNDAFITLLYDHVFHRAADPSGRAYWLKKLNAGTGRGQMLYELSNSPEFRNDTAGVVRIITTRFGLLRVAPSPGEILASAALSQRSLIDTLRTSLRYASRFSG